MQASSFMRRIGALTLACMLFLLCLWTLREVGVSGFEDIAPRRMLKSIALYWIIGCSIIGLVKAWGQHRVPLLVLAVSLLVSLLLLEGAVRILQLPGGFLKWKGVPSRKLHHTNAPSRKIYAGAYEGADVFVETNSDGLRTRREREEFKTFGTRIAVIGDSFAFGFGVQAEDALPHQLEKLLRRTRGTEDLAVLNAGVVSSSPLLGKLLFERVVSDYDPQAVVLILDATDIGDDYKYEREGALEDGRFVFPLKGPECGESGRLTYYGAVAEILSRRGRRLSDLLLTPIRPLGPHLGISFENDCGYSYYDFNFQVGDQTESSRFFHDRHPLSLTRSYFDTSLAHVKEMADDVRASGADFLLVISPRYQHWNPEESPENWETEEYASDPTYHFEYFRYFEESREEVDFPILNLLDAFQATDEFPLVFREDPHWNAAGNSFAARVIASRLNEEGLP